MAMTTGGSHGGITAEMNVTPMIDILLVLIIVFMIVVSSTHTKGEEALIPQPPAGKSAPQKIDTRTVVVEVTKSAHGQPTLTLNQQPVAWSDLRMRLQEIYMHRAERVLFVKADRDLDFEPVAEVIDIAHADFPDMRVGLITARIEAGG